MIKKLICGMIGSAVLAGTAQAQMDFASQEQAIIRQRQMQMQQEQQMRQQQQWYQDQHAAYLQSLTQPAYQAPQSNGGVDWSILSSAISRPR